jgi:cation diffusion facilitator family transporter
MSTPGVREQKRAMGWSLVVAVVLLVVKVTAAAMTGSAAIYSDAAESVVHVVAVAFAVWALRVALKPADKDHHFGHEKAEFMSAGFEGGMISVAALLIFYEAARQFWTGVQIENLGLGMWLTGGAAAVNLVLGFSLVAIGKRRGSPLLRANGMHVLTDVWTSAAVLGALVLIRLTGWLWWDPIVASLAAANILRTGLRLIRESYGGLMDRADPEVEAELRRMLDAETSARGLAWHNLRHRSSGRTQWVEFHLVFPDDTSVRDAHEAATAVERRVSESLGSKTRVISHLEPRSAEHAVEAWEGGAESGNAEKLKS